MCPPLDMGDDTRNTEICQELRDDSGQLVLIEATNPRLLTCHSLLGRPAWRRQMSSERSIGICPDPSRIEEELPTPHEAGLLAEVDDLLEEALEDVDAEPLPMRVRLEWSGSSSLRA
jgi:hypothetical protein